MTIADAILALTIYPITSNTVEVAVVTRGLAMDTTFDATVSASKAYRLATADIYTYLSVAPSVGEQEVKVTLKDQGRFERYAQEIYGELGDAKFAGINYGFAGEDY